MRGETRTRRSKNARKIGNYSVLADKQGWAVMHSKAKHEFIFQPSCRKLFFVVSRHKAVASGARIMRSRARRSRGHVACPQIPRDINAGSQV